MVRLGTKYQIDHIREDAIHCLSEYFPTQLDLFRNSSTELEGIDANKFRRVGNARFLGGAIGEMTFQHAIVVLKLAQECHLPQFLPTAYYICAQLEVGTLLRQYVDVDGGQWKLSRDELEKVLIG